MPLYSDKDQVYLFRPNLLNIVVPELPEEYTEKKATKEMIPHWALLLHQVFGGISIQNPPLVANPLFSHNRVKIVSHKNKVVGVCIGWECRELWPFTGQIFFTAVDEKHRNKGIGGHVVAGLIKQFKKEGFKNAILSTETYRIPAIHLYIKQRFFPLITREIDDEVERWEKVLKQINKIELLDKMWKDYTSVLKG